MKGERDERARQVVLRALGRGESVTAAARAAGVARTTPYQWADRGDLEMRDALASAKRGGGGRPPAASPAPPEAPAPRARPKLHKDERLALDALRGVAEEDDPPKGAAARVAAAKALLDHHRKRRQDAQAEKVAAPPSTHPGERDGDGEDLGALITRLSG